METAAADGLSTFSRDAEWLGKKTDCVAPSASMEPLAEPPPPLLRRVARAVKAPPRSSMEDAVDVSDADDDLDQVET